jgi:SAM-dependent methyltransferase
VVEHTERLGGPNLLQRVFLRGAYLLAHGDPERLPWHRTAPDPNLVRAVEALGHKGRALDVGCGSGMLAAYLARQGLEVVGVDLFREPVEMARTLATKEGLRMEIVHGDVLAYEAAKPFDLVHDSGCLHCMDEAGFRTYERRLLEWLVPGGYFVLGHFDKRHPLDVSPIGPRRRSSRFIERAFARELELVHKDSMLFKVPLSPRVLVTSYLFKRRDSR